MPHNKRATEPAIGLGWTKSQYAGLSVLRTVRRSLAAAPRVDRAPTDFEMPIMSSSEHAGATGVSGDTNSSSFKAKAIEEFRLFWVIAIYLTMMLAAFTWFRRLVVSESEIGYFHYGAAAIEALILAKVVLIAEALKVGRRFEDSRLMLSVLFNTSAFAIFIAIFAMLEHVVEGLVHRDSWAQIEHRLPGFPGAGPFHRGYFARRAAASYSAAMK
jgi:hypothetical protein